MGNYLRAAQRLLLLCVSAVSISQCLTCLWYACSRAWLGPQAARRADFPCLLLGLGITVPHLVLLLSRFCYAILWMSCCWLVPIHCATASATHCSGFAILVCLLYTSYATSGLVWVQTRV